MPLLLRALEASVFLAYKDGPLDPPSYASIALMAKAVGEGVLLPLGRRPPSLTPLLHILPFPPESVTICDCDCSGPDTPQIGTPTMFWSWQLNIFVFKVRGDGMTLIWCVYRLDTGS